MEGCIKKLPKLILSKKGQNNPIVLFVIAIILLVGVSIPITQSVITSANLTGLTATIVGFIPVFLGIAGLSLAARISG